jgi:hypothetical protein
VREYTDWWRKSEWDPDDWAVERYGECVGAGMRNVVADVLLLPFNAGGSADADRQCQLKCRIFIPPDLPSWKRRTMDQMEH